MVKVSVILPAYNVEGCIERSVRSVLDQTFTDIELICVDDGSTDKTGALLDELSEKDERMHVLHTKNNGAPAARNTALNHATGTYVAFFDADDWAEPKMFEQEVAFMEAHNLELLISGFYIDTFFAKDRSYTENKTAPTHVYKDQIAFRKHAYTLFDNNLLYSPWNKLFSRARIEKLRLRFEDTFWDDFPFVIAYIKDVVRVGMLDECFYHFERARTNSETSRYRAHMYEKREEEYTWLHDLCKYWGVLNDKPVQEFLARRYVERLLGCVENVCNKQAKLSGKERKSAVKKMLGDAKVAPAFKKAKIRARHTKLLLWPIKHKLVRLTILEGKFLAYMRKHHMKQFAHYKAER